MVSGLYPLYRESNDMTWHKILEQTQSKFWRDLGLDLVRVAAKTLTVELVRSNVLVWREVKLKRKRRALDLIYRDEDESRRRRQKSSDLSDA